MAVVYVECRGGFKSFLLKIGEFDSVRKIKEKIEKQEGIPISRQTIIFNDERLPDDFNVRDSRMLDGFDILLLIAADQHINVDNNQFHPPLRADLPFSNNVDLNVEGYESNECKCLEDVNNVVESTDLLMDEIVSEQLSRNIQFFGLEHQKKVVSSYVVVIGLGGVGSHAASMLLRSGVGKLLLVDFDRVSVSSLNRHAVATREDVGTRKALCLKKHFSAIFPESKIEAKVQLYDSSSEDEILSGNPDFVLDCIGNIDTKVALLAACVRRGLKVLSATGAGARADPTRIRVADLRESTNDPLSRAVRYRLRKDYGIDGGIPVVFSLEKPKAKLLPFKGPNGEEQNPSDDQVVPGFRARVIPVLGTIPAIFGQVMASYVVTQLAELQVHMEPVVDFDIDHYRVLHQRLIEHEESQYGTADQVQVDVEEVMYIVKELWHGRSARDLSAKDVGRGMWRSVNELMLVRWDRTKPASISNLVLLKLKEGDEHESRSLDDIKEEEAEFFARVTSVLKQAQLDLNTDMVSIPAVCWDATHD